MRNSDQRTAAGGGARTTEQTERAILLAGEIAAELDPASVKACQREADRILKARYN